ncbi:MAG: AMP-binding protein [Clostridiales bacterium]|nr:AMP-binding protein [Candidatus Crickella merdequi]
MANFRMMLEGTVAQHENNIAFTLKNKTKDSKEVTYRDITFKEFYSEVKAVAVSMVKRGMAGKRIALAGINQYTWVLGYLATQLTGGISVPLDKGLKFDELEFSLERAEADYLFFDKSHLANANQVVSNGIVNLEGIISLDGCSDNDISAMLEEGFAEIEVNGTGCIDSITIDDHALAVLLFTSGTTSLAKIVMLSQNNIIRNTLDTLAVEDIRDTDTSIAFLPYHHIFGSTGQWVILAAGTRTVYCDGLKYIQKNLQEYGVSIFFGVPLIIENMYKKVLLTAEKNGMLKKLQLGGKVSNILLKLGIDVRRKLFSVVHEAFGGKLRLCIIGGAAADAECIKGFKTFGITAIQGYGLTETSPVLAAERMTRLKPGSIGITNKGVELKIFEPDEKGVGEIIARGETIMLGYYKNQEATDEAIVDGWFHTGDLAYMDKDGFIFITGRKKNVIVLKNGKKVFPEELESLLAPLSYATEAVVLGVPEPEDERDLVVTLKMVYDPEAFPNMSYDEVYAKVKEDVELINETTPTYKRIRRIILTDQEMVKTSTGKVKRYVEVQNIINERENQDK